MCSTGWASIARYVLYIDANIYYRYHSLPSKSTVWLSTEPPLHSVVHFILETSIRLYLSFHDAQMFKEGIGAAVRNVAALSILLCGKELRERIAINATKCIAAKGGFGDGIILLEESLDLEWCGNSYLSCSRSRTLENSQMIEKKENDDERSSRKTQFSLFVRRKIAVDHIPKATYLLYHFWARIKDRKRCIEINISCNRRHE